MPEMRLIDANALVDKVRTDWGLTHQSQLISASTKLAAADAMCKLLGEVGKSPTIDAVPVVRCRNCKNGAPLPEEAKDEFSPGVMRCLTGRGDCDMYCTTWEDGFCDEGAKMDLKEVSS